MVKLSDKGSLTKSFSFSMKILFGIVPGYMIFNIMLNILFMDEPAAALDAAAEERMYNQFVSLSKDFTAVFVSHRMASARLADRIACVKDGQIVEFGSHDELMARGGYYRTLYLQQAELYR